MEEGSSSESFGFAFNDPDFSDRLLHVQIVPDELSSTPIFEKLKYSLSLHLSSPILAAKSPFFYKLFKKMSESQQKEATLKIHSSEETALMDLLKFMYTNTLSATTFSDLVDVLMAADKFEVKSCIKHCIQLLTKMPVSLQTALSCLHLPSSVLATKPLIDASKEYLVAHFKDLNESRLEAMQLPLDAVEIVLGSESLRVSSEDDVYEYILQWTLSHYRKLEERQKVLNKLLLKFISFPYLSCSMLRNALVCPHLNSEQVSKLVMEALFHKAEEVSSKYFTTTNTSRRIYTDRLVKVVPIEFSMPRSIIYFNLKKEDCMNMLPDDDGIYTKEFLVGRHLFSMGVECSNLERSSSEDNDIIFYLLVDEDAKAYTSTFDIEFAVMKKSSNEYEIGSKNRGLELSKLEEGDIGEWILFEIPMTTFLSDESEYFIDNILHIRAEINITKSLP